MQLGVFLAIGESWEEFVSRGQDSLLLKNNYYKYSKSFEHIWIFNYGRLSKKLTPKITLVGNRFGFNRFIYSVLLVFLHAEKIRTCNVLRGMQLTGAIPALLAKYRFGKPAVINYGYNYVKVTKLEKKYIRSLFYRILEKCLLPLVDHVIVTTPTLYKNIFSIKRNNLHLIPNGINIELFQYRPHKKDIPILFVGRLEEQKNVSLLIQAVAMLKGFPRVVLIGSGSLRQRLFQEARMLKVNLKIINLIPNHKLATFYNRAQVFVLPSLMEGHPKVLLEAMSCGVPVIGTNVEGITDIIQHRKNGLIIHPNVSRLASALTLLLKDKKLAKQLGQFGRQTIEHNFDSRITWKKEIKLLKHLAKA